MNVKARPAKSKMSLIKVILINITVFIFLIISIELISAFGRILIGKPVITPNIFTTKGDVFDPRHPCNEQKTDVLLSHASNHLEKCSIKGGKALDDYVVYNSSSSDKPILLSLGGSTTSGFYQNISDGETWPKLLSERIHQHFKVINGGDGGYSSLQELLKFFRDGPRFKNLSLVISLNGINELKDYHGKDEIRSQEYPFLTDIQFLMNQRQSWIDQRVSKDYFGNLIPNLTSLFRFFYSKPDGQNLLIQKEEHFFKVISAADRWEKNMLRLNKLVELEGAKFLLFLQPTMGLDGVQSRPPLGSNDYKLMEKTLSAEPKYFQEINILYNDLRIRCKKMDFCFDLSNTVPPIGNVYNDVRHHNDKGNRLLVDEIYKILSEELNLKRL